MHIPLLTICCMAIAGCAAAYGDRRTDDVRCSAYVDERRLQTELAQAADCCTGIATLPLTTSKLDGDGLHGLIKSSPVFTFPEGKSRFAAFALDRTVRHKYLMLRAVPSGRTTLAERCDDHKDSMLVGHGSERYRAIEPLATFLDASGSILAAGLSPDSRNGFRISIPDNAAVLIVHTAPARYGADTCLAVTPQNPVSSALAAQTTCGAGALAMMVTATGYFSLQYAE
jgi:hypothetical protein